MEPGEHGSARNGRAYAFVAAVVGVLVCAFCAVEAWADAHVTYALPTGTGHDVLNDESFAAAVAALGALACLVGLMGLARRRLTPRACWVLVVLAVVVAVLALALFEKAPAPTY